MRLDATQRHTATGPRCPVGMGALKRRPRSLSLHVRPGEVRELLRPDRGRPRRWRVARQTGSAKVEAVRWSRGALGRVPRFAQRRVILFFWPIRASSANQISIVSMPTAFSRAIASRRAGKLF